MYKVEFRQNSDYSTGFLHKNSRVLAGKRLGDASEIFIILHHRKRAIHGRPNWLLHHRGFGDDLVHQASLDYASHWRSLLHHGNLGNVPVVHQRQCLPDRHSRLREDEGLHFIALAVDEDSDLDLLYGKKPVLSHPLVGMEF